MRFCSCRAALLDARALRGLRSPSRPALQTRRFARLRGRQLFRYRAARSRGCRRRRSPMRPRSSRRLPKGGCSTGRRPPASSRTSLRQLFDAATGERLPANAPAGLKPVRLNNRVRRAIEAALGGLTLLIADPAKRSRPREAVFKSRDAAALPVLEDRHRARRPIARIKRADAGGPGRDHRSPSPTGRTLDRLAAIERAARARRPGCAGAPAQPAARRPGAPALKAAQRARSPRSRAGSPSDGRARTSGTASRSARCCCLPRSGLPSPSA